MDSDAFFTRLGLVSGGNTLGEITTVDTDAICEDSKLSAVQDFGHGVTCGKRDSRAYYDANLAESFTNPGEWPWAALIFRNGEYIGEFGYFSLLQRMARCGWSSTPRRGTKDPGM